MSNLKIKKVAAAMADLYYYFNADQFDNPASKTKLRAVIETLQEIKGIQYYRIKKTSFEEAVKKGEFAIHAKNIRRQEKDWYDSLGKEAVKPEVRSNVAIAPPTTEGLTGNVINDLEGLSDKLSEFSGIINNKFNFGWSPQANVMANYAEKFQMLSKSEELQNINLKSVLMNIEKKEEGQQQPNAQQQQGEQQQGEQQPNAQQAPIPPDRQALYADLYKHYSKPIADQMVAYCERHFSDNKGQIAVFIKIFELGRSMNVLSKGQMGGAVVNMLGMLVASFGGNMFYCGPGSESNFSNIQNAKAQLEAKYSGVIEFFEGKIPRMNNAEGFTWKIVPQAGLAKENSITERLMKIANDLDTIGLFKEAEEIDLIIKEGADLSEKTERTVRKIDDVMTGKPHIKWKQEEAVKWVNTFTSWNNYIKILHKQLLDVRNEVQNNSKSYNNLGTNNIQGLLTKLDEAANLIGQFGTFFATNFGRASAKFNSASKASRGIVAYK